MLKISWKLWQPSVIIVNPVSYTHLASRFIMMNLEGKTVTEPENLNDLCAEDKWILSHLNTVIREATENMEIYELGIAVQKVYGEC